MRGGATGRGGAITISRVIPTRLNLAAHLLDARSLHASIGQDTPQKEVSEKNARISSRNKSGAVLMGVGAAAAVGGALLLLLPDSGAELSVGPNGLAAGFGGRF